MEIKKKLTRFLKKELNSKQVSIKENQNEKLGDFSLPCFNLAEEKKENPIQISKNLEKKINKPTYVSKIEALGPYLNFYINKKYLAKTIIKKINKKEGLNIKKKNKKVIVIESPGPNTNKPLHLGHVRNLLIGDTLAKLNNKIGNISKRVDIINDRGVHICKSMLAYQKYGKNKAPNKKTDHFVGDYYILYDKKSKKDKNLEQELKKLLIKWESQDKKTIKLWKKMNEWAISGIKETYSKFGTKINKYYFESRHYDMGKKIIEEGVVGKQFTKDEKGNIVCDLSDKGLGKKVVLRNDGTSVYITQDIALAKLRYSDYKMDQMIYVVANEQEHHFKTLFEILKKLKFKGVKKFRHLSYGYISLPGGKMKSREGTVVDADALIEEMSLLATKELKKRNKKLSKNKISKISQMLAIGAINFFILKYDPKKDFTYHPGESISFEGETGPYLQYTLVRINSLLKKTKTKNKTNYSKLTNNYEQALIKQIGTYLEVIKKSTKECKPSLLCHFLIDLCKKYNSFYQNCKVLGNKDLEKDYSRLKLTEATGKVISEGLEILGIEVPEEM